MNQRVEDQRDGHEDSALALAIHLDGYEFEPPSVLNGQWVSFYRNGRVTVCYAGYQQVTVWRTHGAKLGGVKFERRAVRDPDGNLEWNYDAALSRLDQVLAKETA